MIRVKFRGNQDKIKTRYINPHYVALVYHDPSFDEVNECTIYMAVGNGYVIQCVQSNVEDMIHLLGVEDA